jgi:trehalose-6-phosphate synthase
VCSDVAGASHQLGDAALIIDPRDPGTVADAILAAADPVERARLVAAGEQRAHAWTADDYVRGFISFADEFERERRLWL